MADYLNSLKKDCVRLSEDGKTLTMLSDVNLADENTKEPVVGFVSENKEDYEHYVLDLNGKSITSQRSIMFGFYGNEYTFEITDSQGSGKIESLAPNEDGNPIIILPIEQNEQLTLQLHDCTLISNNTILYNWSYASVEMDGVNLICRNDYYTKHFGALSISGQSKLTFTDGQLSAEKTLGMVISGVSEVNIEGGTIKAWQPISMQTDSSSSTLHISGGTIQGTYEGAILCNAGTVEISGEPVISGPAGILASGLVEDDSFTDGVKGSGATITINGGRIAGISDAAFSYLLSAQYQGAKDGQVTIHGGSFIAPENTDAVVLKNLSTKPASTALTIQSCACSQKLDRDLLNEDLYQVYNNNNPDCPWYYCSDLSQALSYLSLAPFNTMTFYSDLASPAFSLTLDANVPESAGTVEGLFGKNQYIASDLNQGSFINLPVLQLSGYAFKGWYSAAQNGQNEYRIYSAPTTQSSATLYGQWSADPDTPAIIPTSGKGIDEMGSQTVANTSSTSSTTYYLGELGNRVKSVTNNSAPSIAVKTDLSIFSVNEDNSLQNPLELSLGENSPNQALALAGNQSLSNAPSVSAALPFSTGVVYISLPLASGTAGYSTAAMTEENGTYTPLASSLVKNNRLIFQPLNDVPYTIVNNVKSFKDVTSTLPQYGQNAIAFMSSRGLMSGVGNKEYFDPAGTLTRAQFATILYRFAGKPNVEDSESIQYPADVRPDLWYSKAAAWAYDSGYMAQGSNFDAARPLSREELATILYRIQHANGGNTSLLDSYNDGSVVSEWAKEGMAWAIENQIIGQGSNLNPLSSSNQVNTAAMFERYLENVFENYKYF